MMYLVLDNDRKQMQCWLVLWQTLNAQVCSDVASLWPGASQFWIMSYQ